MLGGSSETDPSPATPIIPTGEASMPIATSHLDSNPGSSLQDHVAPTDASPPSKQIDSSEASQLSQDASTAANRADRLHVPSRTSLRAAQQTNPENAPDATNNDSEKTLRSTRRSILKGRRDRSKASSMRSRRQHQEAASVEEPKTTSPDLRDTTGSEKKGKASYRFFAFLSCCSSTDVDPDDTAIPAKRTAPRPSAPNSQPTPEKADVHAGDSSTADSKDHPNVDEKANATVIPDQSQSQEGEESAAGHLGPNNQLDGPASTPVQPDEVPPTSSQKDTSHLPERKGQPSESEPQVTSEKSEALAQKPADQATVPLDVAPEPSPETNGDNVPAVAETSPKDELKYSTHDEEANKLPTTLPPPPPAPGKEVQTGQPERQQQWLLPPPLPHLRNRKCLVLDLDETLVHSSFKVLERADFTIPVEIEGQYHNIYVIKRPGVDQFMKRVGELYEVVVFTASVSKYGDPLLDQLDIHNVVHHRLFRDSCYNHQGNYVKDLSQVGRDLRDTIIIDNSPTSYIFHPQHAIPISSWFSDAHDNELLDLIPVLEDLAGTQVKDVSLVLDIAL
ncbi:general stress response phosphoprotein phosphatase Psr1 [Aspergillus terreus]|uniref:General stress response phosphoprotein phosphatase Psr1 n=1 Tax=Aspergillus terreus TaxID=33178 RepID=A0A5M3YV64_ASPTE|nr:hypothetical protein ATETN484_0004071500 [Aspergillus terreus]GFF13783.1 general stress response phosphoprotein phosphatase Psr1 [Aspergillus terreus]